MWHMINPEQKQSIGRPLGRIVSGVYVLTAKQDAQVGAMLASWVQQCGFEPPCVSIAIAKGRPITELIRASGRLALSIVSAEDKTLMKYYARLKPGEDPFAGVATQPAPNGVPVLSDALGYLDCELRTYHDFAGDHELFIAQVTDGEIFREGSAFAHQRGNGFHY